MAPFRVAVSTFLASSTERVLTLLDRHDVTATFFIVGELAAAYPDLVARIANEGHELGTHGHTHTPLFDLDRATFASELDRSIDAIESAADVTANGFRALNFSVTPETAWAFDVMSDTGLQYDSSVFPLKTPMYGVRGAPTCPYRVDPVDQFADQEAGNDLLEIPMAVHPRYRVLVAGGFYSRLIPKRVLEWGINALNARGRSAVLYFHPWEFNPDVRSAEPQAHARFVSYHGIEKTADVLERLLERYSFETVAETVGQTRTD